MAILAKMGATMRITIQSQGAMTAAPFVHVGEEGENRVHRCCRGLYAQAQDEIASGHRDDPPSHLDGPSRYPDEDSTSPTGASQAACTPYLSIHATPTGTTRSFAEVTQPYRFAMQHALILSTQAAENQVPLERVAMEQAAT